MEEILSFVETDRGSGVMAVSVENCSITATSELRLNIETNILRDTPRFLDNINVWDKRAEPIAIVGGGLTLRETVEEVRSFKQVMVCGSAHDYLVSHGVIPNWAVIAEAAPDTPGFIQHPQEETTYLLASHCSPYLFEMLRDFKVQMWNSRINVCGGTIDEVSIRRGEQMIGWGPSVTHCAIHHAVLLGFNDHHFFGFDACYQNETETHCYPQSLDRPDTLTVKVGDRRILTDAAMLMQADYFFRILDMEHDYFHATIHGNGLIAEMVRHGDPALSEYVSLA